MLPGSFKRIDGARDDATLRIEEPQRHATGNAQRVRHDRRNRSRVRMCREADLRGRLHRGVLVNHAIR